MKFRGNGNFKDASALKRKFKVMLSIKASQQIMRTQAIEQRKFYGKEKKKQN